MSEQRTHLRVPLRTSTLYVDDNYVLKTKICNISEGGICLDYLPCLPKGNLIIYFPLILYPDFKKCSSVDLKNIDLEKLSQVVISTEIKIIHNLKEVSEVEVPFLSRIGCTFVNLKKEHLELIQKYSVQMIGNITYMLMKFSDDQQGENEDFGKMAQLIGYSAKEGFSSIYQNLLKDYEALEN